MLGQHVHTDRILRHVVEEFNLRDHLIGERTTHHETRVAGGATEVDEAAFGKHDHRMAVGEGPQIGAGLEFITLCAAASETRHVDLVVEVANVADDGVVLHLRHVIDGDDHLVAGRGNKDVSRTDDGIEHVNLVALHRCLQRVDRVDLRHDDAGSLTAQTLRTALADIAIAADDGHLAGNHHVGCTIDGVNERVTTAVEVVELALGDAVVHVDRRKQQLFALSHLVEPLHAGSRFFCHSANALGHACPLGRVALEGALQETEHDCQLWVRRRGRVGNFARLFVLHTLVQEQRGVAAVIKNHVRAVTVWPRHHLVGGPPVLLECLALPRKHGHTVGLLHRAVGAHCDRSRGVVLRRKNVATRPANLGAELDERLDEHCGLHRHVQRAGDTGSLQWFEGAIFLAQCAQPGHLMLSEMDFFAAERRERHIGDAIVLALGERG